MISVVDVSVQSENPTMPLYPMRAFKTSPSNIRIRNVPKKIGKWNITKVYFTAHYPDDSLVTAQCVLVGGIWVGTIQGTQTSGFVENGYTISADGIDENGNETIGYILGKGDVTIIEADGSITPSGGTKWYVHLLSDRPTNPNDGDMWYENDAWFIWQNDQALPIGDDSGIIGNLSERVDELTEEVAGKQDELTDAEQYALSDTVYDLATKFYFTDNTTSTFNFKDEVTFDDFVEAGLVDENGTWLKQPRNIEVGEPVKYFHENAFSGCTNLATVVFYGKFDAAILRNYPWGISNTSIIKSFYNASQYWVQQQGYASNYQYQNIFILPFGTRVAALQPYKVNSLTFSTQMASFRVDVAGTTGTMRDMYFVFTVPSDSQPMTWNTYFDRFEGGDAASVAPTSGTNIYHIYEYTSGHFAVEKFNNTYTKSKVDSKLNSYELKTNLTSDVSAIVTATAPVAEFTFAFVSGNPVDVSLYRAVKTDASDEPRYNIYYVNDLIIQGMLLADDMSYPQQLQDDLNGCIIDVTKTTENRNAFGFASYDWVKNYINQYMQEHQS